jgi:hypothetical protein
MRGLKQITALSLLLHRAFGDSLSIAHQMAKKSTYLPAPETTHTQLHGAATSLILMKYS